MQVYVIVCSNTVVDTISFNIINNNHVFLNKYERSLMLPVMKL